MLIIIIFLGLFFSIPLSSDFDLFAHGYIFDYANDEMRDNIRIDIYREYITVRYESVYLGQIAPHIRNMIDINGNTVLTEEEVEPFIEEYKKSLNPKLKAFPIHLGNNSYNLKLVDLFAPGICSDSLLAPLRVDMLFVVENAKVTTGETKLVIDPKLFFINGNQFVNMAKQKVDFTDDQEEKTGRFLQIQVFGNDSVSFISTYPGRLKKNKQMVYIYGVFYDETPLQMSSSRYPHLKIKFKSP